MHSCSLRDRVRRTMQQHSLMTTRTSVDAIEGNPWFGTPPRHGVLVSRERIAVAVNHAMCSDGVISRAELRRLGIERGDVAREVGHGRWVQLGRHSVAVYRGPLTERGLWRHALHEVGSHGTLEGNKCAESGRPHRLRRPSMCQCPPRLATGTDPRSHGEGAAWLERESDVIDSGLRRTRPALAAVRAAAWARTDRNAALILVMTAQQRVAHPADCLAVLARFKRLRRRDLIKAVLMDVFDGAQSLGELDFARECRRRGLPEPSRQVVRKGPRGRVYLDLYVNTYRVIVEIEGAHHDEVLNAVDDALRQNHLSSGADDFLRIPVTGLRTDTDAFMRQLEGILRGKGWRPVEPGCG